MPGWTREQEREALATVSTLKRVLGIPNHPTKKDTFVGYTVHIFAPDETSATLIGELLYRYGNGPREAYYNAHPEFCTLRDTVSVRPVEGGGYDASMDINYAPHFQKGLEKMIKKQIAPDSKFSR